jgi:HEAT repeat protein
LVYRIREENAMPPESAARVKTLTRRLHDPDFVVRFHAGIRLGELGPAAGPAVPALLKLLRGDVVHDRRLAAVTLGRIGHRAAAALPALRRALRDADATVRRFAADALAEIEQAPRPGKVA